MGSTDKPDLAGDLQAAGDILKRLESAIAAVRPPEQGVTAPGAYLMQLLGSVGAPAKQCRMLAHMLLTAATSGGDAGEAASAAAPPAKGTRSAPICTQAVRPHACLHAMHVSQHACLAQMLWEARHAATWRQLTGIRGAAACLGAEAAASAAAAAAP